MLTSKVKCAFQSINCLVKYDKENRYSGESEEIGMGMGGSCS